MPRKTRTVAKKKSGKEDNNGTEHVHGVWYAKVKRFSRAESIDEAEREASSVSKELYQVLGKPVVKSFDSDGRLKAFLSALTVKESDDDDRKLPAVGRDSPDEDLRDFELDDDAKLDDNGSDPSVEDIPDDDIPDDFAKAVDTPSGKSLARKSTGSNASEGSPLFKKFKGYIENKGITIKVHWFSLTPDNAKLQPVVIEIIDDRNDFTHWLERGSVWDDIIKTLETDNPASMSNFIKVMRNVRMTDVNGEADTMQHNIKSGSAITLYREGLRTFVLNHYDESKMKHFIKKFWVPFLHRRDVQQCYQIGVANTSRNNALMSSMLAPLEPNGRGGEFWKLLDDAMARIITVEHKSLKEILGEEDIRQVIMRVFPEYSDIAVSSREMSNEVIAFGWGD